MALLLGKFVVGAFGTRGHFVLRVQTYLGVAVCAGIAARTRFFAGFDDTIAHFQPP